MGINQAKCGHDNFSELPRQVGEDVHMGVQMNV